MTQGHPVKIPSNVPRQFGSSVWLYGMENSLGGEKVGQQTPGDRIRKASAMASADERWVRALRYAMMLEIESFIDRENFRRPLSTSQIDALSGPDRRAYRFSRCIDMLDMIAPIENEHPADSARLAIDFADYLHARHVDPGCEPPRSLMGELLSMDLGN